MTSMMDWSRHKFRLSRTWIYTVHPNPGTKLAAVLAACDGAWRTSGDVRRLTGIKGGTVRPLLYAAAQKRLLLRRESPRDDTYPAHLFQKIWQYRLIGT